MNAFTMNNQWARTYDKAIMTGHIVAPRGQKIRELNQHTIRVDMNYPVLTVEGRKPNYRFMAAEALWILDGKNDVRDLTPYNARMAEFSDDGEILAGAYGPRILSQVDYVLHKLLQDRDTRQATLTIWTPNPEETKDYPCTIAMDFKIRNNRLNCHVFMRSSDIWLGLPYDVFAFTCVALMLMSRYNEDQVDHDGHIRPGDLYLTAASSHVYQQHWDKDIICNNHLEHTKLPTILHKEANLRSELFFLRGSKPGDVARWWDR